MTAAEAQALCQEAGSASGHVARSIGISGSTAIRVAAFLALVAVRFLPAPAK